MSEAIQAIRTQAQELLARAHVDQAFSQLLQKQPDLALAGLPYGAANRSDELPSCGWFFTCRITFI